nr:hypothetical protein [Micromonospora sp. DSM 115978]
MAGVVGEQDVRGASLVTVSASRWACPSIEAISDQAQTVVRSWYFNTSFASRPQSVVVADRSVTDRPTEHTEDLATSALLPDLLDSDGDVDTDRLEQALRRGLPILCPAG